MPGGKGLWHLTQPQSEHTCSRAGAAAGSLCEPGLVADQLGPQFPHLYNGDKASSSLLCHDKGVR